MRDARENSPTTMLAAQIQKNEEENEIDSEEEADAERTTWRKIRAQKCA